MLSATSRTFLGVIRIDLLLAVTSILCLCNFSCYYSPMCSECYGWRKFTQPMSYHTFYNIYIHKYPAIMYAKCMSDKFRWNLASTFPGFNCHPVASLFLCCYFF